MRIPHFHPARKRCERAEHHRDDARCERRVNGDDETREVLTFLYGIDRFGRERRAALGVGEELLSCRGQYCAARSALEHFGADDALEVTDAIADRGLRHDELARGASEAAAADDGEEE